MRSPRRRGSGRTATGGERSRRVLGELRGRAGDGLTPERHQGGPRGSWGARRVPRSSGRWAELERRRGGPRGSWVARLAPRASGRWADARNGERHGGAAAPARGRDAATTRRAWVPGSRGGAGGIRRGARRRQRRRGGPRGSWVARLAPRSSGRRWADARNGARAALADRGTLGEFLGRAGDGLTLGTAPGRPSGIVGRSASSSVEREMGLRSERRTARESGRAGPGP
jgi:hypothetical protein